MLFAVKKVAFGNGITLSHDANGNLTGDGVWTYGYDLDNRLKSASKTGLAAALHYDVEGRLRETTIAGVTTKLLYDGADLVAEYDSAGNLLRRYVHGPGTDEPLVVYEGSGTTAKNWLYADHLGSVIATADAAGNATSTLSYGPFGEPNQTTGVRFRYTGQQLLGQLNLYHYKARFYSPALGRFLQTDPIGYADDLNLYAYVGNDPINATDPSGLAAVSIAKMLAKLADKGIEGVEKLIARRGWRVSERESVEQAATRGQNGGIVCPGCQKEVSTYDINHVKKWGETQKEILNKLDNGETVTRAGVRDLYGKNIEAKCASCNRADNKLSGIAAGATGSGGGILGTDVTWEDVGYTVLDIFVGIGEAGAGSDIYPRK